ncbi:MAG: PD40 domain-containing protein [Solirubrobacteraceae bacterium]|nr:PD40 domain-containing protein [Solirubrobacteraceae bacterium]
MRRVALATLALAVAPASAAATPPGTAGPIYFADYTRPEGAIARILPSGGNVETILPGPTGSDPAISPDGSTVAFSRSNELWTVPSGGGTPTQVTNTPLQSESSPAWSARGTHLAYVVSDGGISRLEIIEPANPAAVEALYVGPASIASPSFSPDDSTVAYTRTQGGDTRVHTVARATQVSVPVGPASSAHPDWSPDGSLLAYDVIEAGTTHVEVGPPGGAGVRLPGALSSPSFSPAGDAIAVTTLTGNSRIARHGRGPDGAWATADDVLTPLTSGGGYGQRKPSWAGTGAPPVVWQPPGGPALPNGTTPSAPIPLYNGRIFFETNEDDPLGEIYSMDPAGGEPERLTRNPGLDGDPDVSRPDAGPGQRVAFSRVIAHRREIWTMRPDGSNQRRLALFRPGELSAEDPSWAPDGRTMAFTGRRPGEVRTSIWVGNDGPDFPRRLSDAPVTSVVQDSAPAVSPDGRLVAFRRTGADFIPVVCTVAITGGPVTCSWTLSEMLQWRPCNTAPDICDGWRTWLAQGAARGIPAWTGNEVLTTAGITGTFGNPQDVVPYGLYADDENLGRFVFRISRGNGAVSVTPLVQALPNRRLNPPAPRYGVPSPDGSKMLMLTGTARGESAQGDYLYTVDLQGARRSGYRVSRTFRTVGVPAWQALRTRPGTQLVHTRFRGAAKVSLTGLSRRAGVLRATVRNAERFGLEADVRVSKRGRSPIGRICRGARRARVYVPGRSRTTFRVRNVPRGSVACLGVRDRRGTRRTTRPVRLP